MSAPARIQAALDRVRATEPMAPKIRHGVSDLPRAVAVMPEHHPERSVSAAADYCAAKGYRLAAVANLRVALTMVLDQVADVVVAASDGDLAPLVEVADRMRSPKSAGLWPTSAGPAQTSDLLRRPQPRLRGPFGD